MAATLVRSSPVSWRMHTCCCMQACVSTLIRSDVSRARCTAVCSTAALRCFCHSSSDDASPLLSSSSVA